jgi:hypothetical protein
VEKILLVTPPAAQRARGPGTETVDQEDVARRAWAIHLQRGRPLARWRDLWQQDWEQAERPVRNNTMSAAGRDPITG